jgi:hypothetical protein
MIMSNEKPKYQSKINRKIPNIGDSQLTDPETIDPLATRPSEKLYKKAWPKVNCWSRRSDPIR